VQHRNPASKAIVAVQKTDQEGAETMDQDRRTFLKTTGLAGTALVAGGAAFEPAASRSRQAPGPRAGWRAA